MPESLSEWLVPLLWGIFFTFLAGRLSWNERIGLSRIEFQLVFAAKVLVGVGLLIFYQLYYGSRNTTDALRFYDDALIVFEQLNKNPEVYFKICFGVDMSNARVTEVIGTMNNWTRVHDQLLANDNQTMIRFNALLMPLSRGFYHVHTVVINFLSLSGFVALIQLFKKFLPLQKWQVLSILFFPQVVLWSSGVLKEALLFFFMGWFLYQTFQLLSGEYNKGIFVSFAVSFFMMLQLKPYILACLIPGFTMWLVTLLVPRSNSRFWPPLIIVAQLALVVVLDSALGSPRAYTIFQKQMDFIRLAAHTGAGSLFASFVLEPTWISILKNSPEAFVNTLIRPLPTFSKGLIVVMSWLENAVILGMLVTFLIRIRKSKISDLRWMWISISFIVLLWTLSGLTTPVAGALVRYKIPAIPFLLVLFFSVLPADFPKRLKSGLGARQT